MFQIFSAKAPITMTWSNLPSKTGFKSALEISKWSKRSAKKTFTTSISFAGKNYHPITLGLSQSIKALDVCPVQYLHLIPQSKGIKYEDLPDACGWDNNHTVMRHVVPIGAMIYLN